MTNFTSIIQQLEQQRSAIDNALEALRGVTAEKEPVITKRRGRVPKGPESSVPAEGRQRQIEAMRKYWAAKKARAKKGAAGKATKKRGLTAAGRKALSENMKRMWAAKRAANKSAQ